MEQSLYFRYSDFLKQKYGQRVYKLPVSIPVTCPNRDGTKGVGGCIYCCEAGAGLDSMFGSYSVKEQLLLNMEYIGNKYKVDKFIAYFQNFTNTYLPAEDFERYINEANIDNVVEICISTRPDCVGENYLAIMQKLRGKGVNVSLELGLQSVNYKTLEKINRGHTLAEFISAMLMTERFGFDVCVHLILNLPWDDMADVIEAAKILSALKVRHVKLHALYLVPGSIMYESYKNAEFELISVNEYMERVIAFLEYLSPDISVQRLIGRTPKEINAITNWGISWWKIRDDIERIMRDRGTRQGIKHRRNIMYGQKFF